MQPINTQANAFRRLITKHTSLLRAGRSWACSCPRDSPCSYQLMLKRSTSAPPSTTLPIQDHQPQNSHQVEPQVASAPGTSARGKWSPRQNPAAFEGRSNPASRGRDINRFRTIEPGSHHTLKASRRRWRMVSVGSPMGLTRCTRATQVRHQVPEAAPGDPNVPQPPGERPCRSPGSQGIEDRLTSSTPHPPQQQPWGFPPAEDAPMPHS